jgi:hypothetical protein
MAVWIGTAERVDLTRAIRPTLDISLVFHLGR